MKGGKIRVKKGQGEESQPTQNGTKRKADEAFSAKDAPDSDDEGAAESDSESEEEEETPEQKAIAAAEKKRKKKLVKLDAVGKALATKMISSKKTERDMYDDSFNRYMMGDEDDVPEFFHNYLKKYNCPRVEAEPVSLFLNNLRFIIYPIFLILGGY